MLMKRSEQSPLAGGFSMIEVLLTLAITAFGLLALAGFAMKTSTLAADAAQRARAGALLSDMANRLSSNKANAVEYVSPTVHGAAPANCGGLTGAALELCQWNNLLAGTNDAQAGGNAEFLGFRGCVTQPDPLQPVFIITIAWGSMMPGTPPADPCAAGAFGDDSLRRVLRSQVRIAALSA
jgi:type IV pilus assembly protein PilV